MTIVLVGSFAFAILLIAGSAWLHSRVAYGAILGLLGIAMGTVLLMDQSKAPDPLTVAIVVVVYGALIYFVSVQFLMHRKVTDVSTRADFKLAMEASGRFHGVIKVLYYLPIALLGGGILLGVIGKLSEM